MAIIIPNGLTTQEIRVLQEFRRLNSDSLTNEQIKAIRHPAGGGEPPALALVTKGYLSADGEAGFSVTERAKEFLSIDVKPEFEEPDSTAATAGTSPEADVE